MRPARYPAPDGGLDAGHVQDDMLSAPIDIITIQPCLKFDYAALCSSSRTLPPSARRPAVAAKPRLHPLVGAAERRPSGAGARIDLQSSSTACYLHITLCYDICIAALRNFCVSSNTSSLFQAVRSTQHAGYFTNLLELCNAQVSV